MTEKKTRARKRHDATPLLEWVLGGIGVLLFLGAIAFLVYEGSSGPNQPAGVEIRIDAVIPTEDAYLVRYRAYNQGTQTLVDLHVTARVLDGSKELERVEAAIDFLPGRSWRRGGVYLHEDPRKYRLEVRAAGYQEP